jgi:hypothetical protein
MMVCLVQEDEESETERGISLKILWSILRVSDLGAVQ